MVNSIKTVVVLFLMFLVPSSWIRADETPQIYRWSLDEAVEIAFTHNPDLKAARASYEAAKGSVLIAVSDYLPHIALNAGVEDTTLPAPSTGLTDLIGTAEGYAYLTANVRQLIFDFGKVLSKIDSASASKVSAEQRAIALRNSLKLAVEEAFFNVNALSRLVDVAKKSVERYQETFRRAQVMVRTGARPRFDLSQASVELAKAETNYVRAQTLEDLGRITLLNLMGTDPSTNFSLIDPKEEVYSTEGLQIRKLIEKAIKHRPEIAASEADLSAARYQWQANTRDYFPKLELDANYGRYFPNYPSEIRNAWGAGIFLSWDILDGLKTVGRGQTLEAKAAEKDALLEKEKQTIIAQVSRAFMTLLRSETNLKLAEKTVAASSENYGYAEKRYQANVGTILELLIAESSLLNAEAGFVEAQFKNQIDMAGLVQAVNAKLKD